MGGTTRPWAPGIPFEDLVQHIALRNPVREPFTSVNESPLSAPLSRTGYTRRWQTRPLTGPNGEASGAFKERDA